MPGMTKAKFFDKVAEDGLWQDFAAKDQPKLGRLLDRLDLGPGMKILEPGCGTGRLTAILLEHIRPNGAIVANDISPRMIAVARRRRLGRHVRWLVGPTKALRVPAHSMDRVVCFQSFPHFDDKPAALRLFRKSLRPDGLLAMVHFASRRKVNRVHSHEAEPISHDLLPTQREMRTLLREAGFQLDELADTLEAYWLFARPA